jgi:hypothetical protein
MRILYVNYEIDVLMIDDTILNIYAMPFLMAFTFFIMLDDTILVYKN